MNKAKAIFAAGVIVVVAGSSAGLWYLNENGYFGKEPDSAVYEEYEKNDGVYDDDYTPENIEDDDEDIGQDDTQETQQSAEKNDADEEESPYSDADFSEFLSVFTKAYFYDNGNSFSEDSYSSYELIRFAYAHINRTSNESVIFEEADDSIRYYYKVPAEKINSVLEKYLGISVPEESVFTENDYAFFRFKDSYFYTPAADGLPFINTAEIESVDYKNGIATVTFTVFSGEEKYATGEAKISTKNDDMRLVYYKIKR